MAAQFFPTHLYCGYSLAPYSYATQSELLQNTATNTKFNIIFLHIWPVLFYYSFIFSFVFWTKRLQYIYIQSRTNANSKGSSMRRKRGEISKIGELQKTIMNFQMMKALCLWKAHLKNWSSMTITPTPTRLPARS